MANLFKYASKAAYDAAASSRPANESSVSFDGGDVHFDGKNPLVPLKSASGVNIVVKDSVSGKKYAIPVAEYKSAAIDPRFVVAGVMFGKRGGKVLIMHKDAPSRMWGQSGFYLITPTLSANGSFHWAVTINGTAKSGDVTWESGATVASLVSQINAVVSNLASAKGSKIGITVNTYSNSTFTLSSVTGATLEDLSTQCWVDGTKKTEVHRGWQNVAVNSLELGLTGFVGASDVLYSKAGYNNSYRCGANFPKWKSWASASGNASYVAESAVDIMKQTAFEACATGSSDAQAVYNKYNGSYDAYLKAHMVKLDDVHANGMEYKVYDNGLEQTALLASVMTLDLDGNRVPAFPAAYAAYTAYVSGDDEFAAGKWHLPTINEIGRFMDEDTRAAISTAMTAIGGNTVGQGGYYWSVAEFNSFNAWFYYGAYGNVSYGNKFYSYSVRPLLALEV